MITETQTSPTRYAEPGFLNMVWLIARRQMIEALSDRSTYIMTGFFLAFQTVVVLISLGSVLSGHLSANDVAIAGTSMAFFLLFAGLLPSAPAISIAAGVFAGDKERGCLTPLLVTPASNAALFAGKVLGAILPALFYTVIGVVWYLAEIALLYGPDKLGLFPVGLTSLVVLLIPAITFLGTALASLISSRVSTFQSAQNYSSLIMMVLWVGLGALLFAANTLALWIFGAAVIGVYILDALLIWLSATTWKREEVMARL